MFSLEQLNDLPELAGIYKFYSSDTILLYIGKAKNLKNRVQSYFQKNFQDLKTKQLVSQIHHTEIIPVASEFEALLLEAKLIREKQPKYNVVWRDDKHYIYIKISTELFPKILFARKVDYEGIFFGPFPASTIVREILSYLRTIFPYCTQKENAKRACFYHHLGLCNPCPSEIVKFKDKKYQILLQEYRQNIHHLKHILEGKINKVKAFLESEMQKFSTVRQYEKAALYRDKIIQLDYLVNHYTPVESYLKNPKLLTQIRRKEQNTLTSLLMPYFPDMSKIDHIECYDVSNLSGSLATGSMVTFKNGEPVKALYRRFRIKFNPPAGGPNDFVMLNETLTRRLAHKEWLFPNLFVIDGGKPQLAALKKILQEEKIKIPVIGLAKKEEEIVVPKENFYIKIKLPRNSSALNLIKRLRDEAHRFAHSYHSLLRLKYLMSSVEN